MLSEGLLENEGVLMCRSNVIQFVIIIVHERCLTQNLIFDIFVQIVTNSEKMMDSPFRFAKDTVQCKVCTVSYTE